MGSQNDTPLYGPQVYSLIQHPAESEQKAKRDLEINKS